MEKEHGIEEIYEYAVEKKMRQTVQECCRDARAHQRIDDSDPASCWFKVMH